MKYKVISFIIVTLFIYGLITNIYINSDHNFSSIKDKIIRLHVVANSDSSEDQALKLQIRNAVIEEIAPRLKNFTDTEKVKTIIENNLHNIKKTAEIGRASCRERV